ncbi:MAG: DUF2652 domain-containing protein [Anaerolineales bacterium]|jgi:hypothetical protein
MTNKGYFIITDISGYTDFLTKSELDHAQAALQSLFDVQLAQIKHPFVISGFRGDAIFMYVPETNFVEPQALLESLEKLYFVFADTLRQMKFNTTCTCRACQNIANLDLKMVIHYGEYAIQKLADREELLGADVIIPHRMLKNHVIEKTGIQSYALFSEAAAKALNLSELAYPLVAHTETYEHLGEVSMQILDLHQVWDREQDKKRILVPPESAWLTLEWDLPYPPPIIWEYLTVFRLEKEFAGYDSVERTDSLGGRTQTETTYHCAHGEMQFFNKILDWKPFEYYTIHQRIEGIAEYRQSRVLTPTEKGTRLAFYTAEPPANATEDLREFMRPSIEDYFTKFKRLLESDIASGKITLG